MVHWSWSQDHWTTGPPRRRQAPLIPSFFTGKHDKHPQFRRILQRKVRFGGVVWWSRRILAPQAPPPF